MPLSLVPPGFDSINTPEQDRSQGFVESPDRVGYIRQEAHDLHRAIETKIITFEQQFATIHEQLQNDEISQEEAHELHVRLLASVPEEMVFVPSESREFNIIESLRRLANAEYVDRMPISEQVRRVTLDRLHKHQMYAYTGYGAVAGGASVPMALNALSATIRTGNLETASICAIALVCALVGGLIGAKIAIKEAKNAGSLGPDAHSERSKNPLNTGTIPEPTVMR